MIMGEEYLHSSLTSKVINCFFAVYNTLGYGFLEKVYEKSLQLELELRGFKVEGQKQIDVYYCDEIVGVYFTDLVVDDILILEIKAAEAIRSEHESQLLNYLKATDYEIGLLLNFGVKPEFKRKIFTNDYK